MTGLALSRGSCPCQNLSFCTQHYFPPAVSLHCLCLLFIAHLKSTMVDPITISLTVTILVQLRRFIKHVRDLQLARSKTASDFIRSFEDLLNSLEHLGMLRDEAKYLLHENYRHEIMRREIQAWGVVHSIGDTVMPLIEPNAKHQSLLVTFLEGSETRKIERLWAPLRRSSNRSNTRSMKPRRASGTRGRSYKPKAPDLV